jgi:hypothetical protein
MERGVEDETAEHHRGRRAVRIGLERGERSMIDRHMVMRRDRVTADEEIFETGCVEERHGR